MSAVTLAVGKTTDGKEQTFIGLRHTHTFSEGAGIPEHTRRCRRILKHQSNCPAILFFKVTWFVGANWKSNPASSQPCTWRKENFSELKVLSDFSKIIEAASPTACDQGLITRVHICWESALSFFYCTDLCYLNT